MRNSKREIQVLLEMETPSTKQCHPQKENVTPASREERHFPSTGTQNKTSVRAEAHFLNVSATCYTEPAAQRKKGAAFYL